MSDLEDYLASDSLDAAFAREARELEQQLASTPLPSPKDILDHARDKAVERIAHKARRRRLALLPLRLAPLLVTTSFLALSFPMDLSKRLLASELSATVLQAMSGVGILGSDALVGAVALVVAMVLGVACLSIQESWSSWS